MELHDPRGKHTPERCLAAQLAEAERALGAEVNITQRILRVALESEKNDREKSEARTRELESTLTHAHRETLRAETALLPLRAELAECRAELESRDKVAEENRPALEVLGDALDEAESRAERYETAIKTTLRKYPTWALDDLRAVIGETEREQECECGDVFSSPKDYATHRLISHPEDDAEREQKTLEANAKTPAVIEGTHGSGVTSTSQPGGGSEEPGTSSPDESGWVHQKCTECGYECDSSTITRAHAETYDPRCPRCGRDDTMRMVRWTPLPGTSSPDEAECAAFHWLDERDTSSIALYDLAALIRTERAKAREAVWNEAVEQAAQALEDPKLFNVHPRLLELIRAIKHHDRAKGEP